MPTATSPKSLTALDERLDSVPDMPAAMAVCVDLDGTLVRSDLLWESFVALFRRRPLHALALLVGLLKGKAHFKHQVAMEAPIDPATLPYRPDLIAHLEDLHGMGVHLALVTGSDRLHASAVADYLGIFAEVIASDGRINMTGRRKAAALRERFGEGRFHYIGNDWADVPVWRVAGEMSVVGASPGLSRYLKKQGLVGRAFDERSSIVRSLARALRPHQWVKNLLVFIPGITSHTIFRPDRLRANLLTFVAFSLCASAIYILNDIWDIQADRLHPRKRKRPFAAGELSIPVGCVAAAILLAISVSVATLGISLALALVLAVYVVLTTAYSTILKRVPVADVFALTSLYVLRIVAGGIATETVLSSWLLGFALFFFLSLAFVKRYVELMAVKGPLPGRDYSADDAMWMHAIGTSAGYMAVLVLALYVTAPDVTILYTRPQVLWLLCPLLLFWLTRLWFRAGRRLVHDDPVLDALKDPFSYAMIAAAAGILLSAI